MYSSNEIRVGLTGGIGSGKSTVAQILVEYGAALIDADAISRSLTLSNGSAIPLIAHEFGTDFIASNGALDREKMRNYVFSNPSAKQSLEAILHPLVAQETEAQLAAAKLRGSTTIIFDIPLLVESTRWRTRVDHILVVDCQVDTQIQRVIQRSHLNRDSIKKIIESQASREQRLAAADWVIYNDDISLNLLAQLVLKLPLPTQINHSIKVQPRV